MSVKIFAHRGASEQFAEHTRAAYLQALADGADGVECDLHLSADGELILLHDDDVGRTSNGSGPVAELTLAQLRALDFSSWKGAVIPAEYGTAAQQLLTLDQLLDILTQAGRPVDLAIEFKYGAVFDPQLVDATLAKLRLRGWSPEQSATGNVGVSFMSFHPEAIQHLAQVVPAQHLCQLLEEVDVADVREELDVGPIAGHTMAFLMRRAMAAGEKLLEDGVAQIAGPGTDYLRANPENATQWLAAGRRFRVWTVDTADDLALCVESGVSEVTSNRPADIRALLDAVSI
ncbi:glycerophosphodiester phosphodiesterase family protein [Arthrobacter sp. GMC3]|uniref:glycerophosphodiester phosphodiesterase n=1 Tax=Arthrobacter sp. GMC3 TaxID=2058894 RepID=UPI000CE51E3C|nr:glycerophosphodiester phosphodiesterase family protein [Arthrobacter sp. GMC3]